KDENPIQAEKFSAITSALARSMTKDQRLLDARHRTLQRSHTTFPASVRATQVIEARPVHVIEPPKIQAPEPAPLDHSMIITPLSRSGFCKRRFWRKRAPVLGLGG